MQVTLEGGGAIVLDVRKSSMGLLVCSHERARMQEAKKKLDALFQHHEDSVVRIADAINTAYTKYMQQCNVEQQAPVWTTARAQSCWTDACRSAFQVRRCCYLHVTKVMFE